jgi:hypothetical protein
MFQQNMTTDILNMKCKYIILKYVRRNDIIQIILDVYFKSQNKGLIVNFKDAIYLDIITTTKNEVKKGISLMPRDG